MLVGTVKEDLYLVIIFWHSSMKFMCSAICLIYIYIYSHTLQCNFMVRSLTSAIVIFWSYVLDTLSHSVSIKSVFISFYPQNYVNTHVRSIFLVGYNFGSTFCGLGSPYSFILQVCHFLFSVLLCSLSSFNINESYYTIHYN